MASLLQGVGEAQEARDVDDFGAGVGFDAGGFAQGGAAELFQAGAQHLAALAEGGTNHVREATAVDDAHRVSTESALHLADILFYVMDYNHVQSELNFMVTNELQAAVPELYLIVNQIDKHREDELSFDAFRRSVHASFAEHGVAPKGIFFTSLRKPDHPYNDFMEVEQLVKQSIRDAQPKLLTSAALTLESLHQEHTRYLTRLVSEAHETMAEQLNDAERRDPETIETELAHVSQQLEARQPDRWVQTFSLHRDQLLKNATLMPFELREKMRRFLESRQRDFKVGLFRSAKKRKRLKQRSHKMCSVPIRQ